MPRGDGPTDRAAHGDRRGLLPGGGLVGAVVAVLLFAAARQIDERRPQAAVTIPVERPEPAPRSDAADTAHSETVLDPLSRRTLEDPVRLARAGSFTLQIAVACRKDTALRLLERAGTSADLYVLPALSGGQECYRFCWGAFDGRDPAVHATLPSNLRSPDLGNPTPRRIADLTP